MDVCDWDESRAISELDIYIEDTRHRPRRQNISFLESQERAYTRLAPTKTPIALTDFGTRCHPKLYLLVSTT